MTAERNLSFWLSAAVLGGVIIAGAAVMVFVDSDRPAVESYYLRAKITQELPSDAPDDGLDLTGTELWYSDGKLRWEAHYQPGSRAGDRSSVTVVDGERALFYEASSDTYYFEPALADVHGHGFGLGLLGGSWQDFLDGVAMHDGYLGHSVESAQLLGRPVELVTVRQAIPLLSATDDARARYWVDRENLFLLATEYEYVDARTRYEAVEVRYDEPIPAERFTFTPPTSAVEVDPPSYSAVNLTRIRSGDADPPAGYLEPSYLPSEYELSQRLTEGFVSDEAASFELQYQPPFGPDMRRAGYLRIEQEDVGGSSEANLPGGDPVAVNDNEASFLEEEYRSRLVWLDGNLRITLESRGLTMEQLLKVATSMR